MTKYGMASQSSITSEINSSENNSSAPQIPDSVPSIVTNHRLHGSNYLQWSQSVFIFICGRGKDGHLTGETAAPDTTDPKYRSWKTDDHLVMSWLINSMTTEVGENFLLHKTAKDIWESARETYSSTANTSEIFEIETRLWDLKQGDMSVTQYFNMLSRGWLQSDMYEVYPWKCAEDTAIYKQSVEQRRTIRFLLGLNKELDEVRGRVMGSKPFPALREAFADVRREESRKKLMLNDNKPAVEGSALLTHNPSPDNRTGKGRPWCDFCRKQGHWKATCWKLHGKPTDWKPSGNRQEKDTRAHAATSDQTVEGSPFTREQVVALQKLINQATGSKPASEIAEQHTSLLAHQGENLIAFNVQINKPKPWIIDSGASDHMTGDLSVITNFQPCNNHSGVRVADGSLSPVVGTGSVHLAENFLLSPVLYVPNLNCNLLSISKLSQDLNCVAKFHSTYCVFQAVATGKVIGSANQHGGLYLLNQENLPSRQVQLSRCASESCPKSVQFNSNSVFVSSSESSSIESQVMLWHLRLGHPNFAYIAKLFPQLFINKSFKFYQCDVCQLAKHTRHVYPSLIHKPSHPFAVIHSDIWGPSRIQNINGARWFLTFIDDHTRTTWTFLMKEKSETTHIFQNFHTMISTQFKSQIQVLKTDNARDYFNTTLGTYLSKHGIILISSCVDTPQQNGVAERKNRHLLEVARALMFTNNVPKHFWGEAILTATYLINRMPSRVLKFKTPRQLLTMSHPHIQNFTSDLPFKVFGCSSFVHIHQSHRTKLDPKSVKCIFLGYSSHQKGYKCYSPITRKIYNSMDVTFFERQPFFTTTDSQGENLNDCQFWNLIQNSQTQPSPIRDTVVDAPPSAPDLVVQAESPLSEISPSDLSPINRPAHLDKPISEIHVYKRRTAEQIEEPMRIQPSQAQEPNTTASENHNGMNSTPPDIVAPIIDNLDIPIAHRKGVRGCTQYPIQKYVAYGKLSPSYKAFVTSLDGVKIPDSIQEALKSSAWKKAVEEEIQALEKNNTWVLTTLPSGKNPVGCKWIFTIKYKADGGIDRFKARLVAKGFTQAYGIDYEETFAPVAKLNTVRVLLSLAVNQDWPLYQLDVKNAFLNGNLEEEVYMTIPPGFVNKSNQNMVCKLKKSIYGLKQSPRAWFDRFAKTIMANGYQQCQADHTLFVKGEKKGKMAILIVYVDDIILTGDDVAEILKLKGLLATEFEIKDLGTLKYFLGMEVARSKEGIVISQRKYILDLLSETGMLGCKPADTPMDSTKRLNKNVEGIPVDKGRYQRLVGKLIYLSHTRPDIAYSVSVASQHMNSPTEDHLEAVYRILRYLKMTPGHGLCFKKTENREIEMYTDASWAGEHTDRRSTTGYCSYVWGNLVTWRSKKQAVVSRSSAESEYRALALGICEGMWLQRLLRELKVKMHDSIKMFSDSQAAISIAKNPVHHDRTKHIEIDRHFISEKVIGGIVQLSYIPTRLQIADILTKALTRTSFDELNSKLGLYNIYNPA